MYQYISTETGYFLKTDIPKHQQMRAEIPYLNIHITGPRNVFSWIINLRFPKEP